MLELERARARTTQQYYAQLLPFERDTLETFASDSELYQYLDAAAFMRDTGVLDSISADVPSLPLVLPRRLQVRTVANKRPIGGLLGVRSYGPWPDPLSRLVQQGDWIYTLHANRVVSFQLDGRELHMRSSVTLGAPIPSPRIEPGLGSLAVPKYAEGAFDGVAVYDNLFVSEGALVVVGNRQDIWALEIIRFAIEPNGELRRTDSKLVHYSGQEIDGYRARLAGDTLLIYFRDNLFHAQPSVYTLPSLDAAGDLLRGSAVYRPLVHADAPRMHTLLRCRLRTPTLSCSARALLGPNHASVLLASDALYLWLVGWRHEGMPIDGSFVYRVPLDGSAPGGVRVRGHPHWSTPMHVTAEALHAVVEGKSSGELELLRLPFAMFSPEVPAAPASHYRRVRDPSGQLDADATTFIDNHMLWATRGGGDGYSMRYGAAQTMQVVPLDGGAATEVPLAHAATFVTELAGHALVAGTDSWNLHLSVIELQPGPPRVVAKHVVRDAVRDLASHGAASSLLSIGGTHWLTLDIAPNAGSQQSRLPLRWTPPSTLMQPEATLPLPFATRSPQQPSTTQTIQLDPTTFAVRTPDQLRTYTITPHPALLQSLGLPSPE